MFGPLKLNIKILQGMNTVLSNKCNIFIIFVQNLVFLILGIRFQAYV
jgi:hypothetical protein